MRLPEHSSPRATFLNLINSNHANSVGRRVKNLSKMPSAAYYHNSFECLLIGLKLSTKPNSFVTIGFDLEAEKVSVCNHNIGAPAH